MADSVELVARIMSDVQQRYADLKILDPPAIRNSVSIHA